MAPGAVCECLEITEKDDFLQSGSRDNSYCHVEEGKKMWYSPLPVQHEGG